MGHNKKLLIFLLFILMAEAASTGILPIARGHLYSLLTSKGDGIWLALLYYFLNYFSIDFFQCFKGLLIIKVSLWYRTLRTNLINSTLGTKQSAGLGHILPSNCPQRIQEDIKLSYLQRITVWSEYFVSVLILIQLFILNISQPILIFSALIYAGLSVWIALRFNPKLTTAELEVQQCEANYRSGLVLNILDISGMGLANEANHRAARTRTEYLLFTKLQLGMVAVLPYAVLIPRLMHNQIDLGTLITHQATFGLIVVNAAILISMYPNLIQGRASESRVREII